jgi:hypothetical protein
VSPNTVAAGDDGAVAARVRSLPPGVLRIAHGGRTARRAQRATWQGRGPYGSPWAAYKLGEPPRSRMALATVVC